MQAHVAPKLRRWFLPSLFLAKAVRKSYCLRITTFQLSHGKCDNIKLLKVAIHIFLGFLSKVPGRFSKLELVWRTFDIFIFCLFDGKFRSFTAPLVRLSNETTYQIEQIGKSPFLYQVYTIAWNLFRLAKIFLGFCDFLSRSPYDISPKKWRISQVFSRPWQGEQKHGFYGETKKIHFFKYCFVSREEFIPWRIEKVQACKLPDNIMVVITTFP